METLLHSAATYSTPKQILFFNSNQIANSFIANGSHSFSSRPLFPSLGLRKSVIVEAKKSNKSNNNKKNKQDTHSFVAKPDEAIGPFPEAVLLKEKKVQEDGRVLPEFADAEEEKLFEFLNLELQSQLKVERMRHYEVVYLIHEKHDEEVGSVNEKVQEEHEIAAFRSYGNNPQKTKSWRTDGLPCWSVSYLVVQLDAINGPSFPPSCLWHAQILWTFEESMLEDGVHGSSVF